MATAANSLGPGWEDQSEYFMGKVAVGAFLVESEGPLYDWTDAQVSQTLNGIYAGLSWWASQESKARLSFSYELHVREPTTWEPIENPLSDDRYWIDEILGNLGYAELDPWSKTRHYNNDLRARLGTDWAYSVFVANSFEGVRQGLFTDLGYAHAYLGGPWLTMSRYSTYAYNWQDYFRVVPAHETGHIFYATDEYDFVQQYSGYLNCADTDGLPGIMNNNELRVSSGTRCQLGWVDADVNGVLDILDKPPKTVVTPQPPGATNEPNVTLTGTASVVPLPNQNPNGPGNDVTISRVIDVRARLGSDDWQSAQPVDGAFDGFQESFAYTVSLPSSSLVEALPAATRESAFAVTATASAPLGPHLVSVRSVNTEGTMDATPANDTFEVTGPSGVELWYSRDGGPYAAFAIDEQPPYAWTFDTDQTGGDGVYRFKSRTVSRNGERSPLTEVDVVSRVDTTPPEFAILGPRQQAQLVEPSVTIQWEGTDLGVGVERYEIRLDRGPFFEVSGTSHVFERLADGQHSITVRAIDSLGNTNETEVAFRVHASWVTGGGRYGWVPFGLLAMSLAAGGIGAFAVARKKFRRRPPDN